MRRPKLGSLVLLSWVDITDDNEWQGTAKPAPEVTPCQSVGWVTAWDRKHVVLVRTFSRSDGHAGDRITFPRGCVVTCEVLKPPAKAQKTTGQ